MMAVQKLFLRLLLIFPLLSACGIINPPEDVPSYLKIDSVSLVTTPEQGSNSHGITDAWVSVQGKTVGVFELPSLFPVQATGTKEVVVQAGIKENGIANTRNTYPFYEPYQVTIDLKATEVDTLRPVFNYTSNTRLPIVENFDGLLLNFSKTAKSQFDLNRTGDPALVFEGDSSMLVTFDAENQLFEMAANNLINFPRGKPVFLELNFKCDVLVTVGLFAVSQAQSIQQPVLVLNASEEWKKIYIELGSIISIFDNAYSFKVFIGGQSTKAGDRILLDNIKLLYLE